LHEEIQSDPTPIPEDVNQPQRSPYAQQRQRWRYVLNDLKEQRAFGIEWVLRLILAAVQFLYPSLLVRTVSGKFGFVYEHVGVELYVLAKLVFYALAVGLHGYENPWVTGLVIYLLSETVFYLTSLIFLADIYSPPVSWRRSVLLLLLNYVEITLAFAVLYLMERPLGGTITGPFHGVFFSFITSAGISFGPLYTATTAGQVIVVCQICVMVLFLILIAQYVTNSLEALKRPSELKK
jgi:hypothetical protein